MFPGFNPSMFNNISPDQMKMTSDMISGMSDDDLRNYAKMAGMPNMDPQMMRQSANMMRNMDSGQFNTFKNMSQNFQQSGGQSQTASSTSSSKSTTSSNQTKSSSTSHQAPQKYGKIEKLKEKGNDFFKKESYDDAAAAYFEAIIEIEELKSENPRLKDEELNTLEVSCRLNYANVKAKEGDYEVVSLQAREVLKIKENGKAYFRLGQALYHFKKYEEAHQNLEKAISLLPGDNTVVDLQNKVKSALELSHKKQEESSNQPKDKSSRLSKQQHENKNDSSEGKKNEEAEVERKIKEEANKSKTKKQRAPREESAASSEKPIESKIEEPTITKETHNVQSHEIPKEKPKNKRAPREESAANKDKNLARGDQKKSTEDVKIEDEKAPETKPATPQTNPISPGAYDLSQERLKQSQEAFSNMSPDQMRMMTDQFKGMDNMTLKNMLSTMGMDASDSQLEAMRSMMTPEMLQNFSKMDTSNMPNLPKNFQQPTTNKHTSTSKGTTQSSAVHKESHSHHEGSCSHGGSHSHEAHSTNTDRSKENVNAERKRDNTIVSFVRGYWQLILGALISYLFYRLTSNK